MKLHGSIDTLPKIPILDRRHLAEPFPPPTVGTPFLQAEQESAADVTAGRDDRDSRRLRQRLQPAHDRQQSQTAFLGLRLFVRRLEPRFSIDGLQDKTPLAHVNMRSACVPAAGR